MSGRVLQAEPDRWPRTRTPERSPYRLIICFWMLLTASGTAGAALLQLLGPPVPAQTKAGTPVPAVGAKEIAPVPVEAVHEPAADLQPPEAVSTVPGPQSQRSAASVLSRQEAISATDSPETTAPLSLGSETPALARPSPRQTLGRSRSRPSADPVQAAVSRLRRQLSTGREQTRPSPRTRFDRRPALVYDPGITAGPEPWHRETAREPYYADVPGPFFWAMPPGQRWLPPPPPPPAFWNPQAGLGYVR